MRILRTVRVIGVLASINAFVSVAFAAPTGNPPIIFKFLQEARHKNWEKAEQIFSFPARMVRTAYEVIGNSCARHYEDAELKTSQSLPRSDLSRLAKAFESGNIVKLADDFYGVIGQGDCEHIWSLQLSADLKRIVGIQIDAEDNVWAPKRKTFIRTDP